jgi:hypothetical protein
MRFRPPIRIGKFPTFRTSEKGHFVHNEAKTKNRFRLSLAREVVPKTSPLTSDATRFFLRPGPIYSLQRTYFEIG